MTLNGKIKGHEWDQNRRFIPLRDPSRIRVRFCSCTAHYNLQFDKMPLSGTNNIPKSTSVLKSQQKFECISTEKNTGLFQSNKNQLNSLFCLFTLGKQIARGILLAWLSCQGSSSLFWTRYHLWQKKKKREQGTKIRNKLQAWWQDNELNLIIKLKKAEGISTFWC